MYVNRQTSWETVSTCTWGRSGALSARESTKGLGSGTNLVGTKNAQSSCGLFFSQTSSISLQKSEDILHGDVFNVDLVLVVEV